ncbi:MAG: exodeoxyribonuclease VII small subunit [Clostridia bacterium]|nr:exodeoxyribonuclease VII small subunit [Clostridia bacterium]
MSTKKNEFEDSLNSLEEIVQQLESGECSLDESIALFEKGMKLSENCSKRLDVARQKIITLTQAEQEESGNE